MRPVIDQRRARERDRDRKRREEEEEITLSRYREKIRFLLPPLRYHLQIDLSTSACFFHQGRAEFSKGWEEAGDGSDVTRGFTTVSRGFRDAVFDRSWVSDRSPSRVTRESTFFHPGAYTLVTWRTSERSLSRLDVHADHKIT